ACGLREGLRAPFAAQLNAAVAFAPYPRAAADLDRALSSVEAALRQGNTGAVLVEPILGRGGCVVPPQGFLSKLCDVAHARGALATSVARAMLGEGYIVLTGGIRGETLTFTPALNIDEELLVPVAGLVRKLLQTTPAT